MRKHLYSPPEFSTERREGFQKKFNIKQYFNHSLIHPFYTLVTYKGLQVFVILCDIIFAIADFLSDSSRVALSPQ